MKGVIESEAKTASGNPVWTLDKGQFLVCAGNFGLSLPSNFVEEAEKKADLLERRLSKLEAEIERINRADDEIRQHAIRMAEFIEGLSAAHPE